MIRVLIEASSPIARAGLESVLNRAENIEVIGSIAGTEQIASEDPDVILADWAGQGEDIPPDVLEFGPRAALVLLLSDPSPQTTLELLRSGVRGVLSRDASPHQIVAALEAVAAGLTIARPQDLAPWLGNPKPAGTIEPLTARETEVLGMIAEGLANKVIGHRLGISEHTVKFHVTSIMQKLDAASRTEAVTIGVRHGLILL